MREQDRMRDLWERQQTAYSGPIGTWRERWIPRVCKHEIVRCTHGDEIIGRRFRRRLCMVCGRALRGPLPTFCWFTGENHPSQAGRGSDA